jgi:hypothetical protein
MINPLDNDIHLSWEQIIKIADFALKNGIDSNHNDIVLRSSLASGIGESVHIQYEGQVVDISEYEKW